MKQFFVHPFLTFIIALNGIFLVVVHIIAAVNSHSFTSAAYFSLELYKTKKNTARPVPMKALTSVNPSVLKMSEKLQLFI